jgi:hypothetical protein
VAKGGENYIMKGMKTCIFHNIEHVWRQAPTRDGENKINNVIQAYS